MIHRVAAQMIFNECKWPIMVTDLVVIERKVALKAACLFARAAAAARIGNGGSATLATMLKH